MRTTIEKSLKKSMSYDSYRNLVHELLDQGKSTGNTQTASYLNYSRLGNARMKRLDKTFKFSSASEEQLSSAKQADLWLVLTEGWCGDAGHALPIMNKIAQASNIDLKIVLRDDNNDLMDLFLTDGNQSIPKLIVWDQEQDQLVGTWGPRPSEATAQVKAHKEKYGSLDAEFKEQLQHWYNKDKGKNIESDLMGLLRPEGV